MGRTSLLLSLKETFLNNWSYENLPDFSSWNKYLDSPPASLKERFNELKEEIKRFEEETRNFEPYYDSNCDTLVEPPTGVEQYWDDLDVISEKYQQLYSLVLIGVYSEFESTLKTLCNNLVFYKVKSEQCKGDYIDSFKDFIESKKIKIPFTTRLSEKWQEIKESSELRNALVHNPNLEILERQVSGDFLDLKQAKKLKERLEIISRFNEFDVKLKKDEYVVENDRRPGFEFYHCNYSVALKNKTIVSRFIKLCNEFFAELIEEVASKIKQ